MLDCKVQLKKSTKLVEVKLDVHQTAKTLIENVKTLLGVPPNSRATLFVDTQKCDEQKTITQLGIKNTSLLEIELNLTYNLKITHDIFSEKQVRVNAFDKVLDLAEKVNTQYRIKRYSIDIWFNNRQLDPHEQLYFAHVQDQNHLQCKLQARFAIEYQNQRQAFTINPVMKIVDVKRLIAEKFQLLGDFDVHYNDRILSGLDDKYFFYGVTQNAQLRVVVVKSLNLQIRKDGTIANYIVNLDETVENLIKYLKKMYKIDKIDMQLKYRNEILVPENTIRGSNLLNNSILDVVTGQTKIRLILIDYNRPQLKFIDQIITGSTIRSLYSLPQFSGKNITFYDSDKKQLSLDFVIESLKPVSLYYQEISESQIVFQYTIKFINISRQQEQLIQVRSTDQVIEHLDIDDINRLKIKYMGIEVHPEYTFKDIGCKDNDVITYSTSNQIVRIKYEGNIHEIEIQDGTTFEQFDEILKDEFHIERHKKYQFIYKERLQTPQIEVLVVYQDDDHIIYRERRESVIVQPPIQPPQSQPSVPPPSGSSQIIQEQFNPPQQSVEQPKPVESIPVELPKPSEPPKVELQKVVQPPQPVYPPQQVISKPEERVSFTIYIDPFETVLNEFFDLNGTVEDIDQHIRNIYDMSSNIFITFKINDRQVQLHQPLNTIDPDSMIVVNIEG